MRRVFDLGIAVLAFVACAPLMVVGCVWVLVGMGRPVLIRQRRIGLHGQPFQLVKIRTMTEGMDSQGALLADEERLTVAGRWLRQTSIDELPQLWNVFRGEMGVVGPRPLIPEYLPRYSPRQARRHEVKPGITGWAQVNGRNAVDWERRLEMDVWYVENRSLWLDLRILGLTVWKVLRRDGIAQEGRATMTEFLGQTDPRTKEG